MKLMISRFIAVIILVIPGIAAMTGFLKMKDALFLYLSQHGDETLTAVSFDWLNFLVGLLLFAVGIGFLGGWIFFRDRKRNYAGPRKKARKAASNTQP
ncbi:uncharacterized protein DUF2627 [Fontibacillus phaseoli]|uniref:Uncharacterized protein DUF2627 n=1 Tax=Fontibacillus phaseoli TaxID=1416533 RepID=A0A369BR80_9BACL|nr:DUF2627 domain-containing protein [Fontibacillus phaseoli]RCX23168.1 uncharacterized protein DUF2627 [Fontibacillus phaseoli]